MRYIAAIACKKKFLIPLESCKIQRAPPKINQLTLKNLWPYFYQDKEILSYMPYLNNTKYPPRDFFFIVLATVRPDTYKQILREVDDERLKNQRERDEAVEIDADFIKAFTLNNDKHSFIKGKPIKRLILKR